MNANANQQPQSSYAQQKLAEMRAKQGYKVHSDIAALHEPGLWPERDNIDDFVDWLDKMRLGHDETAFSLSPDIPEI